MKLFFLLLGYVIIIIIMNEKHSITDVYTGTKNSSTQQELSAVTN